MQKVAQLREKFVLQLKSSRTPKKVAEVRTRLSHRQSRQRILQRRGLKPPVILLLVHRSRVAHCLGAKADGQTAADAAHSPAMPQRHIVEALTKVLVN